MGRPRNPGSVRTESLRTNAKRVRSFAELDVDSSHEEDTSFTFRTRRSRRNGAKVADTATSAVPVAPSNSLHEHKAMRASNNSKESESTPRIATRSSRKAKENALIGMRVLSKPPPPSLISTPTPPKRRAAIKTPTSRKKTPRQTAKHNKGKISEDKSNEAMEMTAEPSTIAANTAAANTTTQRRSRQMRNTPKPSESLHTSEKSTALPMTSMETPRKKRKLNDGTTTSEQRCRTDYTELLVQIPLAETPIANRNKEMRKERRRSSFTMRGKRKSSFGGTLGLAGLPHPDIPSEQFYRHIAAEKTDVIRVRQLLFWCAHKAMDKQQVDNTSLDTSVITIAKDIQNKVIEKFGNGHINTTYFRRDISYDEEPVEVITHKKHPENEVNLKKKAEYVELIQRLRRDIDLWNTLVRSYNSYHSELLDRWKIGKDQANTSTEVDEQVKKEDELQNLDLTTLRPPEEAFARDVILATTTTQKQEIDTIIQRTNELATIVSKLSDKIGTMYGRTHQLIQEETVAGQYAQQIMTQVRLHEQTTTRDKNVNSSSNDAMDLLRAMSTFGR
ncbi:Mis12-Mtw1 protein family-domain-containing protein [Syncephalis plumigaleata]|nr:Mis12-Mtw1 protein family-domain-containing protein [Syncephalis plumigaleata]